MSIAHKEEMIARQAIADLEQILKGQPRQMLDDVGPRRASFTAPSGTDDKPTGSVADLQCQGKLESAEQLATDLSIPTFRLQISPVRPFDNPPVSMWSVTDEYTGLLLGSGFCDLHVSTLTTGMLSVLRRFCDVNETPTQKLGGKPDLDSMPALVSL